MLVRTCFFFKWFLSFIFFQSCLKKCQFELILQGYFFELVEKESDQTYSSTGFQSSNLFSAYFRTFCKIVSSNLLFSNLFSAFQIFDLFSLFLTALPVQQISVFFLVKISQEKYFLFNSYLKMFCLTPFTNLNLDALE